MYVAFFIFPFPSFKIYLSLPVAGGGGGGGRSSLLLRLSLVAVSGGYSLVAASGLLIAVTSLVVHRLWGKRASVVATCALNSYGPWSLEQGSVVEVQGISCPEACGIFLDQESNPCPLQWQVDSLPLDLRV